MSARPSRFSVLKIEGDSEDEAKSSTSKGKQIHGGFIVHAKEKKQRQPKKKATEMKDAFPEEPSQTEDLPDMGTDDLTQAIEESLKFMEDDKKSKEELNEAIAQSLKSLKPQQSAAGAPLYGMVAEQDPLDTILQKSTGSNQVFIGLLQDQIKKLTNELGIEREKVLRASHGEQKYKERYLKLLSLLQDAELKEAVEKANELAKRDQIIEEQASQLKEQQDVLEKLRSQIRPPTQ
ncbi:unnamed protein product, partial [Mesorhabditis belari]|uniref:Uncharacterized protein n=1 Tax=Mesorhabditis belari TaxID=2138241 RepID=A0AAF3EFS5_9BILA